jgi:murein DD-endopeptidase MepM/ murein hydrolase activator NlpD
MNRAALVLLVPLIAAATPGLLAQDGEPRRTAPQRLGQPADRLEAQSRRTPPRLAAQPALSVQAVGEVPYQVSREILRARPSVRMAGKPIHDLPYFGNDLEPGERYYVGKKIHSSSGSQMWGYDIGVMRRGDGDIWSEVKAGTDWSKPKNADFHVYGKPVYAMGDGTVIRCWRNAPENPRPFSSALGDSFDEPFEQRDWLHPKWREKMMSGAGNHLLVEQDDGNLVLYAHAQAGSIPASLCPHGASLYSKADADSEADVPEVQRKRIKAGDKLYLTGNSGNSSAPHLHVHQQDPDGNPIQFAFRRGLSSPAIDGNKANIDTWTRFAGTRIPDGPVLFWPPERLQAQNARHGHAAADFQRWFDHMVDSGYWLEWLDGYSVGGAAYLNHVWRPANGHFRAYFLLTPADYQAQFDKAGADGYRPTMVESSLVGGQVRYSVVFVRNKPGGALARHGLTYDQHVQVMDEAKSKGLSPVNVSAVSTGGQLRYTVLWRSESIGSWVVKSQVPEADYQALYDEQSQVGRKPSYVNAYMHQGKPYYSVVFAQVPGARRDRHGMSAAQYQTEFDDANLPVRAVSGYDGAQQNHRFVAFWRQ